MEAMHAKGEIKKSIGDRAIITGFYVFIISFAAVCLVPFLLVISASFTDEVILAREGYKLIPSKFSLDAYKMVAEANDILGAYKITVFTTVLGTIMSMLTTCAVAYAMSVKNFRMRNKLAFFIYFTMLFNGGLVASYLLITKGLNLKNNILVLLLPSMLNAYNILLMRNFFNGIPESLAESAKIDGANDICILFKIILPISLPGIATIGLFYALGYWNEWYKVMLYISDEKLYTLQYLIMKILRKINYVSTLGSDVVFQQGAIPTYSFRMAAIVAAIGPIVLLYPFLQKYFVSGLTVGSVKG